MNIIEQLKKNRYAFCMWTDSECYGPNLGGEMQRKAQEDIGVSDFRVWHGSGWGEIPTGFSDKLTYRLRDTYEEEPEIEECEIYRQSNDLYFNYHGMCHLHMAFGDPDFIGFKFEDRVWYGAPIMPVDSSGEQISWANITIDDITSGKVKILDATHVLFRRQK